MKKITFLFSFAFLLFSAQAQYNPTFLETLSHFNADSIGRTIQDLENFGNRYCNEGEGNKDVAEYVVARLNSYGITNARVDSFYLDLDLGWLPSIARYCYNATGSIEGVGCPDSTIIIGAHLDAISLENWALQATAPGADDNASGVAVMLEIARIIHQFDLQPRYSIHFVGFDAEEVGLRGAGYDVEQRYQRQEKILAMLNNDMVANQPEDEPYRLTIYWYENATDLAERAAFMCENFTSITPFVPTAAENSLSQNSDSWAYAQYGYRAVFAIEYYFSDYYHTVNDLITHCNLDFAKEVAKMNFALLYEMAFGNLGDGTGISEQESETIAARIYPNPASNFINFQCENCEKGFQIRLFDITGREIQRRISTDTNISLDISNLESGIYLAEILSNGKRCTKKVIVE